MKWIETRKQPPTEDDAFHGAVFVLSSNDIPEIHSYSWVAESPVQYPFWAKIPEPPKRLKPCPFCGAEDVLIELGMTLDYISCAYCDVEFRFNYDTDKDSIIDLWNKRAK